MNTSYLVQIWEYVYSHIAMCRLCILLTSGMISALCMLPLFFLHGPELSSVRSSQGVFMPIFIIFRLSWNLTPVDINVVKSAQ